MASVSGLSSASSIYGSRNVISGLASGMDTESMIENAVAGIKARISSLNQKSTKVEWRQEAMRSIIDKMISFNQKYTSYANSGTNLLSASFFNGSIKTTTNGANASKISATGKTNSDIVINGVKQLATAARAVVKGSGSFDKSEVTGDAFDLSGDVDVSSVSGKLTINYGTNNSIDLDFGEMEKFTTKEEFLKAINDKLKDETIVFSSGTKKASEAIEAKLVDDKIVFSDKTAGGNSITVSASGKLADKMDSQTIDLRSGQLQETVSALSVLQGKTMAVTLNGVTKNIKFPGADDIKDDTGNVSQEKFISHLNDELGRAFGTDKVKVKNVDNGGKVQLQFEPTDKEAKLKVTSSAGEVLGLGTSGKSNYLDTSMSLKDLGLSADADGKYSFTINDKEFSFDGDEKMESVLLKINSDTDAGVKVSYSSLTNKFVFTAQETGSGRSIKMEDSTGLFGNFNTADGPTGDTDRIALTKGQDAIFTASINGDEPTEFIRSTNTVDLDGLKVTLNGTFGKYDPDSTAPSGHKFDKVNNTDEAVTFTSKADSEKIIDVVKSMVEDYNAMVKEIKEAYSTMPAEKNSATHAKYEPLTEEDKADMSETAIKAYEEKAKQGVLFADSDLSSLYRKLSSAIAPGGEDGGILRSIGISTEYSNGLTTLKLDENRLKEALDNNPDRVKDAFTKSRENGNATDGLMQSMKNTLELYARDTGATKGILVERAGTPKVPTSILKNSMKDELDNISKQILKWNNKMSDQIDRYTTQFSRLEQIIAQMNSQSSMLSGLMGGAG